jgi:hypothetical protein
MYPTYGHHTGAGDKNQTMFTLVKASTRTGIDCSIRLKGFSNLF